MCITLLEMNLRVLKLIFDRQTAVTIQQKKYIFCLDASIKRKTKKKTLGFFLSYLN